MKNEKEEGRKIRRKERGSDKEGGEKAQCMKETTYQRTGSKWKKQASRRRIWGGEKETKKEKK